MNLIELKNVSKTYFEGYCKKLVLNDISLVVKPGDLVVLQGKNGAGKTTLLKIVLGLLKPNRGEVRLLGLSPQEPQAKVQVGAVLQEVSAPKNLKVRELIDLVRSYYTNPLPTKEILSKVSLAANEDAWACDLSGGQKQRLYFALALAGNPKLLILDEPTRNLDDEGYKEFWEQIKCFKKEGVTILMVTNNQSDWKELNSLATQVLTLSEGQLAQGQILAHQQPVLPTVPPSDFFEARLRNPISVFLIQTWAEILQLLRTPNYLFGILLFSCLSALLPTDKGLVKPALLLFCGLSMLTFSIDRLGKRVAVERVEGWLKLLKVTPLPPFVYIAAKIFTALLVLVLSLLLILSIGIWKLDIEQTLEQWITLALSLVFGVVPFAFLGLALGYLVEPKSIDSIAGLLIPLGIFSCGLVPISKPSFVQDLIALSPFYHFRELVLWAAGMDYDNRLTLHLLWLMWATVVFGLIAKWAYQRDRVVQ